MPSLPPKNKTYHQQALVAKLGIGMRMFSAKKIFTLMHPIVSSREGTHP
jgi:hypothetical protein